MSEERTNTREIPFGLVPLTTPLSEDGGALAGAALNVGTYTVGPTGSGATYTFAYPSSAQALIIRLFAKWAAASDTSFAYVVYAGGAGTESGVNCSAHVAGLNDRQHGIVSLDTNAKAQIVVTGANTTSLDMKVLGYFI
jgi:hypothetical protein